MEHLSEVVKILDAALMHDTDKATAYANLLASKLEDDEQPRQAKAVRAVIAKIPASSISSAYALPRLPTDSDNALSIVDYRRPDELPTSTLILHPYVQGRIDDFLDSVRMHDKWVSHGVAAANRLLIHGPPGTGKTSIAFELARTLNLPLILSRSDALVSSLLGQTSRNIRNIFDFAESSPSLLFLDEFDALAKNRKDSREIGELQRVVIGLLQNIDALHPSTVVVAATNHPELLDTAAWRRFDFTIRVDLPDPEAREAIWVDRLGSDAPSGTELARLVELSAGLSGAAILAAASDVIRMSLRTGSPPDLPLILRRLARLSWFDSLQRFQSDSTEMAALRDWAPDVFTLRALGSLFGVSTRQASNAIKGASRDAGVRTDHHASGAAQ